MDWKHLGSRIRKAWRASKVSQTKIVEVLDIERQTMGAWMRGQRHPTTTNLEKLAAVIGAELVIDLVHPNEDRATVTASHEGVEAARLVDSIGESKAGDVALRLLRVAHLLEDRDLAPILAVVEFQENRAVGSQPSSKPGNHRPAPL